MKLFSVFHGQLVRKNIIAIAFVAICMCMSIVNVFAIELDVKVLSKQLHDKDEAVSYAATVKLAAYYRQSGDLGKAASLTKKFTVPKGCDQMPPATAVEYVRCVLEAAHVLVLKDKLPEALPLLHWAETRPSDYERAVASLKYAEILVEVKEGERAETYSIPSTGSAQNILPMMTAARPSAKPEATSTRNRSGATWRRRAICCGPMSNS